MKKKLLDKFTDRGEQWAGRWNRSAASAWRGAAVGDRLTGLADCEGWRQQAQRRGCSQKRRASMAQNSLAGGSQGTSKSADDHR